MSGKRVVLTADRSLMTNYRGNFLYGFIACGPYEVLPEWVFDKVFCPSVETDPITGEAKVAQIGLRRIESSLIQGGYKREDYLRSLGATEIVSRQALAEASGPLQKELWSGVVDSVGSTTLVNAMAQTVYGGAVAACGLAGGMDMHATVLPHILRGVALLGIDSVMAPMSKRVPAWERLARDLDPAKLAEVTSVHGMSELFDLADNILAGQVRGRVVIDVNR